MAPTLAMAVGASSRVPLAAFGLGLARCLGVLQILPPANRLGLTGMHRGAAAAAISMLTLPLLTTQLTEADTEGPRLLLLTAKETLLGLLIGVLFALPFWAAETAGELLDQQRGSRGAIISDPISQEQAGIVATLFALTLATLFFISGGMHWLIEAILHSYRIWPVTDLAPSLRLSAVADLLGMLDGVLRAGLVLAAPLLIAMLLGEFGLALVNRFAPQLNMFDLSMSIKGLITVIGLPIYTLFLIGYLRGSLAPLTDVTRGLRTLSGH